MTQKLTHSTDSLSLFNKYEKCPTTGRVREIKHNKKPGPWMVPGENLKRNIENQNIEKTTKSNV